MNNQQSETATSQEAEGKRQQATSEGERIKEGRGAGRLWG
jgi:hypothetical protein